MQRGRARLQPRVNARFTFGALAYDGINLWAASGTSLYKIDPGTGNPLGEIDSAGRVSTIVFDGTFLWTGDATGVRKFDPVTMEEILSHPASLLGPASGLYFDGSWIWAANGSTTIERARACDLADLGGLSVPANAQAIAISDGAAWITYQNSPMISVR